MPVAFTLTSVALLPQSDTDRKMLPMTTSHELGSDREYLVSNLLLRLLKPTPKILKPPPTFPDPSADASIHNLLHGLQLTPGLRLVAVSRTGYLE
jgi:hypothetical protein